MKQVHWQLPFGNVDGTTNYRIDIYAEGAPTDGVKTLVGGATPFKTDEDSSDDFFAPVRSQTGCINIIDEDGTLMADLMPSDNVDKPVRLIRVSDSTVMWQGFLSCEAYTQPYTSRPNEVTLNVNSVLEALKSVKLKSAHDDYRDIYQVITDCFVLVEDIVMFPLISKIYFPASIPSFYTKKIDDTAFFDKIENQYANKHIFSVEGESAYDVIEKICAYSNTLIREDGRDIYILSNSEYRGLLEEHFYNWKSGVFTGGVKKDIENINMSDFEYRGVGHRTDIRCGCKAVEVKSSIDDYDNELNIPDFTVVDFDEYYTHILTSQGADWWDYTLFCTPRETHNNVEFKYYNAEITRNSVSTNVHSTLDYDNMQTGDRDSFIRNSIARLGSDSVAYSGYINPMFAYKYHAGAMFARNSMEDEQMTAHAVNDGIYCSLFPCSYGSWGVHESPNDDYIFSVKSIKKTHFPKGSYVYITADFDSIIDIMFYNPNNGEDSRNYDRLMFALRIGNKWYDGRDWLVSKGHFLVPTVKGRLADNWEPTMPFEKRGGFLIEANEELFGEIELRFYPFTEIPENNVFRGAMCELIFKSIEVGIQLPSDYNKNREDENTYHLVTGSHFPDNKNVSLELSSSLNNRLSPSIIMESAEEQMQKLDYVAEDGTVEKVRPEERLAVKLKDYYSSSRYLRILEVNKPEGISLPNTTITGYDGKTYLPLSESRDWRNDTSTIQCFEVPE